MQTLIIFDYAFVNLASHILPNSLICHLDLTTVDGLLIIISEIRCLMKWLWKS